jgi:uncharacterized protein (TIGR03435 family)
MRFLCLMLLATVLSAAPAFEVATIRPHTGEIRMVGVDIHSTLVTATAMTVREMIAFAYELREHQMQGGDQWMAQTRWDIQASAGAVEPTRPQARQMLQTLLSERFGLRGHRSSMEMPVYAMTITKGGVKLKPPSPFETERSTFNATYKDGWGKAPAPRAPAPPANTKAPAPAAKQPTVAERFPPDLPERTEQFSFPQVSEPSYHYVNPVSGRKPPILLEAPPIP